LSSDAALAAIVQRDIENVAEKGLDLSDSPRCAAITDDDIGAILEGARGLFPAPLRAHPLPIRLARRLCASRGKRRIPP
jgi:hypothetical protein